MQEFLRFRIGFLLSCAVVLFFIVPSPALGASKSYTKLDATGMAVPPDSNNFVMVRDNDTGLIWTSKTDDNSVHDRDNQTPPLPLNAYGHSDWRLPNVDELVSIVDYERSTGSGFFDDTYFPNTQLDFYMAQDPSNPGNPAFAVNFGTGEVVTYPNGMPLSYNYYWRCVRIDNPPTGSRYIAPDSNTIIDKVTGLMWMISFEQIPMQAFVVEQYFQMLIHDGYSDWRPPKAGELATLLPYFEDNPAQISSWSSTGQAGGNFWMADYGQGTISAVPEEELHNVFAVRGKTENIKSVSGIYTANILPGLPAPESIYKMGKVEFPDEKAHLLLPQDMINLSSTCDMYECYQEAIKIPFLIESTQTPGMISVPIDFYSLNQMAADEIIMNQNGMPGGSSSFNSLMNEVTDVEVWENTLYVGGNMDMVVEMFDRMMAEDRLQQFCSDYQDYLACLEDPDNCTPIESYTDDQIAILDSICPTMDWYSYFDQDIKYFLTVLGVPLEEIDSMISMVQIQMPFILPYDLSLTSGSNIDAYYDTMFPPFMFFEEDPYMMNSDYYSARLNSMKPIHSDTMILNADTPDEYNKSYLYSMDGWYAEKLSIDLGLSPVPGMGGFDPFITKPAQYGFDYYELSPDPFEMSESRFNSLRIEYSYYSNPETMYFNKPFEFAAANQDAFYTLEYIHVTFGNPYYKFGVLPLHQLKDYNAAYAGSLGLFDQYFMDLVVENDKAFLFGQSIETNNTQALIKKIDVTNPQSPQAVESIIHPELDTFVNDSGYISPFAHSNDTFIFAGTNYTPTGEHGIDFLILEPTSDLLEAEAGPFASVFENDLVTLQGSVTYLYDDPDSYVFSWVQIGRPSVVLDNSGISSPQFSAPPVGLFGEWLKFRLVVIDSWGRQSLDTVTIYVMDQQSYDDNGDGDVDGLDLIAFLDQWPTGSLEEFALAFGR